jgi:3-oxoacyl-[acyl-carrier-protein] synthase-3
MSISTITGGRICGIFNVIPSSIFDNLQEPLIPLAEREALVTHTGIRFRRRFSSETALEVFSEGVNVALDELSWPIETISALVCVTQTPDTHIPALSCLIHNQFKFPASTACLDINLGCSGYVYGLQQVMIMLQNQCSYPKRALLCCGDISSRMIQNDKTTTPIFSDGISVTALEFDEQNSTNQSKFYFNLETLGSGHTAIYSRYLEDKQEVMRLNGIEVFNYSVQYVPQHIKTLLSAAESYSPTLVILHQANKLINDAIAKRILLPTAHFPSTLHSHGNMASASIPITWVDYLSKPTNRLSQQVLLCGYGVGFSMASALLTISDNLHCKTIEYGQMNPNSDLASQ